MNKQPLIDAIVRSLTREMESLAHAAKTAHSDATNAESKAENKYDTRGLEASYLAGAQAKLAASCRENLTCYQTLILKSFSDDSPIALTAFIELEAEDGSRSFYFLGPRSGGTIIEYEGKNVLVITPASPLGRELLAREVGDVIRIPSAPAPKLYEIIRIA